VVAVGAGVSFSQFCFFFVAIQAIICVYEVQKRYPADIPGVSLLLATIYGFERFRTKRCRQFVNYTNCSDRIGFEFVCPEHQKGWESQDLRGLFLWISLVIPGEQLPCHLHAAAQIRTWMRIQIQLPKVQLPANTIS